MELDGSYIGGSPLRRSTIHCLHAVSCHVCNPVPELTVGAELAALIAIFGISSVPVAMAADYPELSLSYCGLGLARLFSSNQRKRISCASTRSFWLCVAAFIAGYYLWYESQELLVRRIIIVLVAISELCWIPTVEKVQEESFEFFSGVLFVFCGIMFTFGLYPLTLYVAERLYLQYGQRQVTTTESPWAVPQGTMMGGSSSIGDEPGTQFALAQLVPVLVLLIGCPVLAACILVYCWLCEHMSRMIQAVVAAVVGWLGLYGLLTLLQVKCSEDMIGKALLATSCVLMFDACGRMLHVEWGCFNRGVRWVVAIFICYFVLDEVVPASGLGRWRLLLWFAIAIKLTLSVAANRLKVGGRLRVEHIWPTWPAHVLDSALTAPALEAESALLNRSEGGSARAATGAHDEDDESSGRPFQNVGEIA